MFHRDSLAVGAESYHLLQSNYVKKHMAVALKKIQQSHAGKEVLYTLSANGHGVFSSCVLTTRIDGAEGDPGDTTKIICVNVNFYKGFSFAITKEVLNDTYKFLADLEMPIVPIYTLHDGSGFDLSMPQMVLPFMHFVRFLFFYFCNVTLTQQVISDDASAVDTNVHWINDVFVDAFAYKADDAFGLNHDRLLSDQITQLRKIFTSRLAIADSFEYVFNLGVFNSENLKAVRAELKRLMPEVTAAELIAIEKEEGGHAFTQIANPTIGYVSLRGTGNLDGMLQISDHLWVMCRLMWERRNGLVSDLETASVVHAMTQLRHIIDKTRSFLDETVSYRTIPSKELLIRCLSAYIDVLTQHGNLLNWEHLDFWPDYELALVNTREGLSIPNISKRLVNGARYDGGYVSWLGATPFDVTFVPVLPSSDQTIVLKGVESVFNMSGASKAAKKVKADARSSWIESKARPKAKPLPRQSLG